MARDSPTPHPPGAGDATTGASTTAVRPTLTISSTRASLTCANATPTIVSSVSAAMTSSTAVLATTSEEQVPENCYETRGPAE